MQTRFINFYRRQSACTAVGILAVILTVAFSMPAACAQNTNPQQQAQVVVVKLKAAGNLYRGKRYKQSAEALREAEAAFAKWVAAAKPAEIENYAKPMRANIEKARQLLEKQGEKFDPLPELPGMAAAGGAAKPAAAAAPPAAGEMVSFSRHVAPMLLAKCGGCHGTQSKGGFNLGTFASLQRGSAEGGRVIQAGSGEGSRIVEVIQTGDMPRGGGKISPDELALLSRWIDEGAKFDGTDPNAPIGQGAAPAANNMPAEKIMVAKAKGDEAVLFARDIGPAIVANCLDCHGTDNPRARLSLASFNGLLTGGENGPIVVPGKPAESLLIKKLRGQEGAQMPLNRPALEESVIAKFEAWIADGAKYDGPDAAMPTEDVVKLLFAARSSHEDLAAERAKMAARTWKLAIPDSEAQQHESDNLLVMGNLSIESITEIAQTAEDLLPRLRKILGAPEDQPFIKGRLTVFAFNMRYDYAELGTMVERRELPVTQRGHFRHTGIDAYACLVPPKPGDGQSLPLLLGEQLAGAYVASLGTVPSWFATGSARVAAMKLEPKDPRVKAWDTRLGEFAAAGGNGQMVVAGKLVGEDAEIAAYGLVKSLAANSAKYQAVLSAMRSGTPFDQAFAKAYGGTPQQVAGAWRPKPVRGRR
jgi:hypothetical protein